jgi:phytoene dehydrogenase-like protein
VEANARDGSNVFRGEEESSLARLRRRGFSEKMIDRFWRPWLSGIFLESELSTSSRMLEFVFEMFTKGKTAVPRAGMQAIPEQLAAGLSSNQLKLGTRITRCEQGGVWDSEGNVYNAEHIVLAVDAGVAGLMSGQDFDVEWKSAEALYFEATHSPMADPLLMLNGDGTGVINHLADLSAVNPHCAPEGKRLIVAGLRPGTVLEPLRLEAEARQQLQAWFGEQVQSWRLIRHSVVREALPTRPSLQFVPPRQLAAGLWNCGDYTSTASIQGAMESGRLVAEAILAWR